MAEWRSSVMRCDHGDEVCLTCRFLAGDRDESTMMHVIRLFDATLAKEQGVSRQILQCIAKDIEDKKGRKCDEA